MTDSNKTSSLPLLLIALAILAWFEYRTIDGVLAIVLMDILLGLTLVLSIVPIAGYLAQLGIGWYYIIPWVLAIAGVSYSWIVTLIFVFAAIAGFVVAGIATLIVLSKLW